MADIVSTTDIHRGWASFSVVRVRLSDGVIIDREVESHGRAVAVLPYDPDRHVATLVEQLRAPVLLSSGIPHLREVPAGLLEGPDPAHCARREVLEECGLALKQLEHVSRCWTMPGISTEQMDLFLASYAENDRVTAGGGLAEENEQITVVEIPLKDLAAAADDGSLTDMKTLVLVQTLRLRRPQLFA